MRRYNRQRVSVGGGVCLTGRMRFSTMEGSTRARGIGGGGRVDWVVTALMYYLM